MEVCRHVDRMALEKPSFCKTEQVLAFDCAGIERLSVPQSNLVLLLCLTGRADLHCLLTFYPTSCACSRHQGAHNTLSGSSWADTPSYRNVLYPRGAVQLLETMAIALDRRLVRLCRHLSKNINYEAEG